MAYGEKPYQVCQKLITSLGETQTMLDSKVFSSFNKCNKFYVKLFWNCSFIVIFFVVVLKDCTKNGSWNASFKILGVEKTDIKILVIANNQTRWLSKQIKCICFYSYYLSIFMVQNLLLQTQ